MLSANTLQKRQELQTFIEQELQQYTPVQGVVAIGSVASGRARPDSDIDAVVFLDPFDPYIAPAEFTWRPRERSFHSIFSEEAGSDPQAVQFDFKRLDLQQWSKPEFSWPEGLLGELVGGWIAFDRTGQIAPLVADRTTYTDDVRIARLDEAVTHLDQHLDADGPQVRWESLGPAIAHDRLHAAYDYLVQGLFAYNRRWRIWRNREMTGLLALPWLPDDFEQRALVALTAPSLDHDGYMLRVRALRSLFADLLDRLMAEGFYGADPISEAFIRSHEEPGRAWNMAAWNIEHRRRWRTSPNSESDKH